VAYPFNKCGLPVQHPFSRKRLRRTPLPCCVPAQALICWCICRMHAPRRCLGRRVSGPGPASIGPVFLHPRQRPTWKARIHDSARADEGGLGQHAVDTAARHFQYVYFLPDLLVTVIDVRFTQTSADVTQAHTPTRVPRLRRKATSTWPP